MIFRFYKYSFLKARLVRNNTVITFVETLRIFIIAKLFDP